MCPRRDDDPGNLVTEGEGGEVVEVRQRRRAASDVYVAVTDAGRTHSEQNLAVTGQWAGDVQQRDIERLAFSNGGS